MLEKLTETTELIQDGQCRSRDVQQGRPDNKSGVLTTWSRSFFASVAFDWLRRWHIHHHYVFTKNFVPRAAVSAPCTCKPVIAATSVRYPIATSCLALTVSNKPQDNKHRQLWSCNVWKLRTHFWCGTAKWRWSLVVAGRRVAPQHFDNVLPEHKV